MRTPSVLNSGKLEHHIVPTTGYTAHAILLFGFVIRTFMNIYLHEMGTGGCSEVCRGYTGMVLDIDTPLFQHRRKTGARLTGRPPKILMHEGRRRIL
jgi:hypothetical protein